MIVSIAYACRTAKSSVIMQTSESILQGVGLKISIKHAMTEVSFVTYTYTENV